MDELNGLQMYACMCGVFAILIVQYKNCKGIPLYSICFFIQFTVVVLWATSTLAPVESLTS